MWNVDTLKPVVEAVLFAAHRPLGLKDLQELLPDVSRELLKRVLAALMEEYNSKERGIALVEVASGYRFQTKAQYKSWVMKANKNMPRRLSRAALETLAIVAYKQPVTKAEIEQIRGVDVSAVLRQLIEKNLIRIAGRKDVPGKPLLYGTTKRFLEVFQLNSLADLPKPHELDQSVQQDLFKKDEPKVSEAS